MQNKPISIDAASRTVTVDGETHEVTVKWPDGLHSMIWDPRRNKMPGFVTVTGDAFGFLDFDHVKPFVGAWKAAKAAADKRRKIENDARTQAKEDERKRLLPDGA